MRAIAIDTNAYTAFKRGDAEIVEVLQRAPAILLSVTVLGELLGGFAAGAKAAQNRRELAQFIDTPRVRVAVMSANTADAYALLYAALRKKGKPVPTNDLWIAASCIEHGAALLTLDAHFQHMEGLRTGVRFGDFAP